MKKLLILFSCFCIFSSAYSKDTFYPATITFYDGVQFDGLARFNKKQSVEFKISEDELIEELDGYMIKRIRFNMEPYTIFEYVFYKNRYKLLQRIATGKMNAYAQFDEPINDQITIDQDVRSSLNNTKFRDIGTKKLKGSTNYRSGYSQPFDKRVRFFIKRADDKTVEDIKLNFSKEAREWFKDCSEVVENTDSRVWIYEDLKKIVEFYNEFCGE
jgi:hypothetical protein